MELHPDLLIRPDTLPSVVNSINPGKLRIRSSDHECTDRNPSTDPYINSYPIDSCNSVEDPDRFPQVPSTVTVIEQLILSVLEK